MQAGSCRPGLRHQRRCSAAAGSRLPCGQHCPACGGSRARRQRSSCANSDAAAAAAGAKDAGSGSAAGGAAAGTDWNRNAKPAAGGTGCSRCRHATHP